MRNDFSVLKEIIDEGENRKKGRERIERINRDSKGGSKAGKKIKLCCADEKERHRASGHVNRGLELSSGPRAHGDTAPSEEHAEESDGELPIQNEDESPCGHYAIKNETHKIGQASNYVGIGGEELPEIAHCVRAARGKAVEKVADLYYEEEAPKDRDIRDGPELRAATIGGEEYGSEHKPARRKLVGQCHARSMGI